MGKQSRIKRERREHATYLTTVSNCEGTWLERPPDADEQAKIDSAGKILRRFRMQALQLGADRDAFNRFSLDIFRDERFAPLHFSDDMIEMILEEIGEPPVVEDDSDPSFTNYLLRALGVVASARVRRTMAELLLFQTVLNRFLIGMTGVIGMRQYAPVSDNGVLY